MVAEAAEVHERVRPVALHGHDAEVPSEVAGVAPADGQPVPAPSERRPTEREREGGRDGEGEREREREGKLFV